MKQVKKEEIISFLFGELQLMKYTLCHRLFRWE